MPEYHWTVMWAPLRALLGLAEFTGEYKFHDQFGVVLIAGGGRRDVKFDVPGGRFSFPATELEGGAQARYYAIRRGGHALHLGAEFLYERIKFDDPMPFGVLVVAAGGGTLGPFVGYKLVTRVGFTFEAQFGARYVVMNPPAPDRTDYIQNGSDWQPLLHLNVGWSF